MAGEKLHRTTNHHHLLVRSSITERNPREVTEISRAEHGARRDRGKKY